MVIILSEDADQARTTVCIADSRHIFFVDVQDNSISMSYDRQQVRIIQAGLNCYTGTLLE